MLDFWTVRIEAARDALSRTRYAFVVSTIISVAIIVAEYNSTFAWYGQFLASDESATATGQTDGQPGKIGPPAGATANNQARADGKKPEDKPRQTVDRAPKQIAHETIIQEFIKSNRMSVSLLGVNFGMSDAPILGSISLAIISLWFYYCIRRENHLIAGILRDAQTAEKLIQQRTFYGITGYLVFSTLTHGDEPITALDQPISYKPFFLRPYIRIVIYLPAIAIAFIVVSDLLSLIMPPLVRDETDKYPNLLQTLYYGSDPRWWWQLVFMEVFAFFSFALTFNVCMLVSDFDKATTHILKRFQSAHQSSWAAYNRKPRPDVKERPPKPMPLNRGFARSRR
jgi:hypothetical protein